MRLSASVPIIEAAGFDAWQIDVSGNEFSMLGKPRSRVPGRSIIGLNSCEVSADGKSLNFQLDEVTILNLGDARDSIAILLEKRVTEPISRQEIARAALTGDQMALGSGDDAFLAACRSEGLPEAVVGLGQDFLSRVREFSEDVLREGLHRKWVTYPKNFLAITIQNRNKQFCIHVKHSAMLSELSGQIDIRDDRPGYARFWLQNDAQLSAAVKAAKASFGQ